MTICIAALSDDSKKVFYCADQMVTITQVGQQIDRPDMKKITAITDNCVILSSGAISIWDEVIKGVKRFVDEQKLQGKSSFLIGEIATITGQVYSEKKKAQIERIILEPKGLSYSDLSHFKELPDFIAAEINFSINNYYLDASFLVVGYNSDGICHIYKITHPGTVSSMDSEGYASIGNASMIADNMILKSGYQKDKTLAVVKQSILAAKKACEVMPGIGETTAEGVLPS